MRTWTVNITCTLCRGPSCCCFCCTSSQGHTCRDCLVCAFHMLQRLWVTMELFPGAMKEMCHCHCSQWLCRWSEINRYLPLWQRLEKKMSDQTSQATHRCVILISSKEMERSKTQISAGQGITSHYSQQRVKTKARWDIMHCLFFFPLSLLSALKIFWKITPTFCDLQFFFFASPVKVNSL